MKPLAQIESWESVSRKAYWDRNVSLEKWRERTSDGHRSYLPDAVLGMDFQEFVHFYGMKRFIQDWPLLRSKLPEQVANKSGLYDLAWSRLAGGGWNLRPFPEFYSLPKRRRQFLAAVAKNPGKSIYEVAKSLDLQYRRAHEHAANLIKEGMIFGKAVVEGGRCKMKLYPSVKSRSN